MKDLTNISKSVLEIAQTLAQKENIVKLIYNDDSDALNQPAPSVTLNQLITEHYICIIPPVETAIKNNWRNTFITILIDNVMFGRRDDNTSSTVVIYVTSDEEHYLLTDNKQRVWEIMNEVTHALEGKKLSSAGQLSLNSVSHTMLSEFRSAYRMIFNFNEQNTKKVEI